MNTLINDYADCRSVSRPVSWVEVVHSKRKMDDDQVRFYNFLKHYSLDQYHDSFVKLGVSKIAHLKHISEDDLIQIGLQRPERARLHKKIEENFSTVGKLKVKISVLSQ